MPPEPPSPSPLERLGQLIREAREDQRLTQDELAVRAGVGRATVQRYETAKSPSPEFDKIRSIVLALGVDPGRSR